MKHVISETLDLMQRMNLFEGTEPRVEVSRDEIFDILNTQDEKGGGQYCSFVYVKPQSFYKTKKNWRKDDIDSVLANYTKDGNEHWYDSVKGFNDDDTKKKLLGIDGIIAVQKYNNVHWTTPESYNKAYSNYSEKLHNLRMRNGIGIESDGMLGDNHNQRERSDYGPQFNQTGNLSKDFNLINVSVDSTCYVVGEDGLIKGKIGNDVIKAMNKIPTPKGPEKAVSDVLSGEALEAYMKAKAELDKEFNGKNFLLDKILCIKATVNGISYFYINDAVKTAIADKSEIYVQPSELVKIAKEQISE